MSEFTLDELRKHMSVLPLCDQVELRNTLDNMVDIEVIKYERTVSRFFTWVFGAHFKKVESKAEILVIIDEVLATLTPREERIVRERLGFNFPARRTQESVGATLGVTGSRISQIEKKILRNLRHPSRSRRLKAFLEGN